MAAAPSSTVGGHVALMDLIKKFSMLFILVILCLNLFMFEIATAKGARNISKGDEQEEELEIERQLRILNKPPIIKTIHTEWGDILDCIDINKQPAFDHPLLKNHKIQMKPSTFPYKNDETILSTQSESSITIINEGCPEGTIPIRRTSKEDLIRARSLSKKTHIYGESKVEPRFLGQRLLGLKYDIPGETYYGASGIINVYNPTLTHEDQYSSAEIAVENGADDQINGIRAGWTVNPQLYGDHNTRLFILWTTDNYQKTVCYNTLCPGFVQVDQKLTPGAVAPNTSVYGGAQFTVQVLIYQDPPTGNWWLIIADNIHVGYWPKSLFGSLSGGANRIYWGGHVKASQDDEFPAMGNGHCPQRDYSTACYYKQIQYVNGSNALLNPREKKVRTIYECSLHRIDYLGFQEGGFGHTFLFGGPGGRCP